MTENPTIQKRKQSWWRNRFVTLMVIPERTRTVHRFILPSVGIKIAIVLISLSAVLLFVVGIDYVHVLGQMAENKRLRGENFKLRQELQVIRNKVESMEYTIDRVRNYGKKLQAITGQAAGKGANPPKGLFKEEAKRAPASKKKSSRRSQRKRNVPEFVAHTSLYSSRPLVERITHLKQNSMTMETDLSRLQGWLMAQEEMWRSKPLLFPIQGRISSGFGYRRHPYDGQLKFHRGIDVVAEERSPVRAPGDGTIVYAGRMRNYGKIIVIDHGFGTQTVFAHLSRLFKTKGVRVKRGDVIGQVGSTGRATGPHLHYEIRVNGTAINPAKYYYQ